MAVELNCSKSGSPSIKKEATAYSSQNYDSSYQIVIPATSFEASKQTYTPELKFGKVNFKIEQAKQLGNFALGEKVNLNYIPLQIFSYRAYKKVIRGSRQIVADEFGFVFLNPFTGAIDSYINKTNRMPEVRDYKPSIYREAMKLVNANAFDDSPPIPMNTSATALPLAELQELALSWVAGHLSVEKTYIQPTMANQRAGDLGFRGIVIKFSKRDFVRFDAVAAFWLPILDLSYKPLNSNKLYKRRVLGFSGEILSDELKCSKTKMLGKPCENFPDNACSSCGSLVCGEHERFCCNCGRVLCERCGVSKGLLPKHYYCQKCAQQLL